MSRPLERATTTRRAKPPSTGQTFPSRSTTRLSTPSTTTSTSSITTPNSRSKRWGSTTCRWDLYMPLTGDEGRTSSTSRRPSTSSTRSRRWARHTSPALPTDSTPSGLMSTRTRGSNPARTRGTYDTQPFILLNYQHDISSMYTLAHELGHSMHSELTKENSPSFTRTTKSSSPRSPARSTRPC